MFWQITCDHLSGENGTDPDPRFDRTGFDNEGIPDGPLITFRLYDDDGVLYFTGKCDREAFDSDNSCDGLYACYEWAGYDSGCTDLRVNGESIYG